KAIKAPNNTGMMLGKGRGAEIVRAVRAHSFPHAGWGRGYKISKEQIVGLLVALEIFAEEGDALYAEQMETAEYFEGELRDIPGVDVCIMPNDESFHEHVFTPRVPRVLLLWDAREIGLTGKDVDEAMAREDPPVFLRNSKYFTYFTDKEWRQIDTYYLREEEAKIVAMRLKKILRGGGSR
ncbi:unnamed protein product, partial [marine sediment metagenome]